MYLFSKGKINKMLWNEYLFFVATIVVETHSKMLKQKHFIIIWHPGTHVIVVHHSQVPCHRFIQLHIHKLTCTWTYMDRCNKDRCHIASSCNKHNIPTHPDCLVTFNVIIKFWSNATLNFEVILSNLWHYLVR